MTHRPAGYDSSRPGRKTTAPALLARARCGRCGVFGKDQVGRGGVLRGRNAGDGVVVLTLRESAAKGCDQVTKFHRLLRRFKSSRKSFECVTFAQDHIGVSWITLANRSKSKTLVRLTDKAPG